MTSPYWQSDCRTASIYSGDCRDVMASIDADTFDSIVTDPPYGLSFMGKGWDHGVPGVEFWTEAMRVAKPGAHLLAFGGTRTYHRLACAIEDAGWEVRDCVMWVYGSGFPKSLDVGKAIDKAAGAEREVVGKSAHSANRCAANGSTTFIGQGEPVRNITAPATDLARQWHGWGTSLKPAYEPIIVARKPLVGTVAANVTEWGTGAMNVDGCRVGKEQTETRRNGNSGGNGAYGRDERVFTRLNPPGRWPANFIHDGSDEVVGLMPESKDGVAGARTGKNGNVYNGGYGAMPGHKHGCGGEGSAARFFYCAKASKADRNEGCEGLEASRTTFAEGTGLRNNGDGTPRNQTATSHNHHPTVKPTALMTYLCRLVTQPDGLILDPFCGSGSTGKAAVSEGFRFVGIEREAEYVEIAAARVGNAMPNDMFAEVHA